MTITLFWPFPAGVFTFLLGLILVLTAYWLVKFIASIVTGG